MCGIFVHIEKAGIRREDVTNALKSLETINHRGPDGGGLVLYNSVTKKASMVITRDTPAEVAANPGIPVINLDTYEDFSADVLFGHKRLSIIDLSVMGHQPMCDSQTGNWITFNGEIYNYLEIRVELLKLKHTFISATDTEVILKAYAEWGTACFKKFNGMWSIVIWDANAGKIIVSNDRYGVKPLFYYQDSKKVIFASEQKQIFISQKLKLSLNQAAVNDFLIDNVLDPVKHTFFNEIHRFKPSCFNEISLTSAKDFEAFAYKPFYTLPISFVNHSISEKDAVDQFNALLSNAVEFRMRADVPYAFALSGGLDSTAVLFAAQEVNKKKNNPSKLASFSAIFPDLPGDESYFIKEVIKSISLESHFDEPFKTFSIEAFIKHIYHQDFPVQNTSYFAEYSLAQQVRQQGYKILVVGQGADEIFGGYTAYFYNYALQLMSKARVFKLMNEVRGFAKLKEIPEKTIFTTLIQEFKQLLKFKITHKTHFTEQQKKIANARSLNEVLSLDMLQYTIPLYLHSDDADGMAFGIESRHPFLDFNLVDFGYSLPDKFKINNGWQKILIRQAADKMPGSVRWRKDKKGYTTPHELWLEKYKADFALYAEKPSNYTNKNMDVFRVSSYGIWLSNVKKYCDLSV